MLYDVFSVQCFFLSHQYSSKHFGIYNAHKYICNMYIITYKRLLHKTTTIFLFSFLLHYTNMSHVYQKRYICISTVVPIVLFYLQYMPNQLRVRIPMDSTYSYRIVCQEMRMLKLVTGNCVHLYIHWSKLVKI